MKSIHLAALSLLLVTLNISLCSVKENVKYLISQKLLLTVVNAHVEDHLCYKQEFTILSHTVGLFHLPTERTSSFQNVKTCGSL